MVPKIFKLQQIARLMPGYNQYLYQRMWRFFEGEKTALTEKEVADMKKIISTEVNKILKTL